MPSPIIASSLAALPGIRHGFFTREGGVSEGIYASLNCGLGSNDARDHVLENRRRIAAKLNCPGAPVVTLHQTHSDVALTVSTPQPTGDLAKADAVVTATPGIIAATLTADCCPVLFADPEAKIVAATHAGWRGAVGGILEATIAEMERSGASRSRILAAIGPCIGPQAYEVGPEFDAEVLELDSKNARFFHKPTPQSRSHFNLPGYVLARQGNAKLANVEDALSCT